MSNVKLPKRYAKFFNLGKFIGGKLYIHRDYSYLIPIDIYGKAVDLLPTGAIWRTTLLTLDLKANTIAFTQIDDFDTADEPTKGLSYVVNLDNNTVKEIVPPADPWIYHHKWLMVMDDYQGFDVEAAKERSRKWMAFIASTGKSQFYYSRIGKKSWWEQNVVAHLEED